MRFVGLAVLALFGVPGLVGGQPTPPSDGSEAEPHLVDAEGDVKWAANTDGTAHEYVDIVAAWLSYSSIDDTVRIVWKTRSNEALATPPRDWLATCWIEAETILAGATNGFFRVEWNHSAGKVGGFLAFMEPSGGGSFQLRPVNHSMSVAVETPGYFEWSAPRAELLWRAEAIKQLRAFCFEAYAVVDALGSLQGSSLPWQSGDQGAGTRGFDLASIVAATNATDERPEDLARSRDVAAAKESADALGPMLFVVAAAVGLGRVRRLR